MTQFTGTRPPRGPGSSDLMYEAILGSQKFNETPAEIRAREAAAEAMRPKISFLRSVDDAIQTTWASSWAIRQARRSGYSFDPEFEWTDEITKQMTDGIPSEYWDHFEDAVSMSHAQRIREQLLDLTQRRNELGSLGGWGIALSVGASILDPSQIALQLGVGALTGGLGWVVTGERIAKAAKAGEAALAAGRVAEAAQTGARIAGVAKGINVTDRFVRGGMIALGTEAAYTGYIASQDPDYQAANVAGALGAAFLLGGGGHAWGSARLAKRADSLGRSLMKDADFVRLQKEVGSLKEVGAALTPKGQQYFVDQLNPHRGTEAASRLLKDLDEISENTSPPRDIPIPDDNPMGLAGMGAMDNPAPAEPLPALPPKTAFDFDLSEAAQDAGTSAPKYKAARISLVSRLKSSVSPLVSRVAKWLLPDALPDADDTANMTSAWEWADANTRRIAAPALQARQEAFSAWANERGASKMLHPVKRAILEDEFDREVAKAVRREAGAYTDNVHINKAADAQRKVYAEVLEQAQRHGMKGMSSVPEMLATYFPRHLDGDAIHTAIARHGEDAVYNVVQNAIRRAAPSIEEDQALRLAKAWVKRGRDKATGAEAARDLGSLMDSPSELAAALREANGNLSDSEIEDLVFALKPRDKETGLVTNAKRRMPLDETHSQTMPDGSTLSVEDLLHNDSRHVMLTYTRQMSGEMAMSEVRRILSSVDNVIETDAQLLNRMREDLVRNNVPRAEIENTLARMETALKSVKGVRLHEPGRFSNALNRIMAVNFIARGGGFIFSQLLDAKRIVGEGSVMATLQQMPVLGSIARRAISGGPIKNEWLQDIEAMFGSNIERMGGTSARGGYQDDYLYFANGGIDRNLNRLKRGVSEVSLMAPVNAAMSQSAKAVLMQKFYNIAKTGKIPSARRLATIGLDEAMAKRISEQLLKHTETEVGIFGRRVGRVNLGAWKDVEAAAAFHSAVTKWSRVVVQESDIGAMSHWMTTDTGRMIVQFRSFMIQGYEKQFLRNVYARDMGTFASFAWGIPLSYGVYAGKTYLESIGRADQQKFLKDRFSSDSITKALVSRTDEASILPMLTDAVFRSGGGDTPFSFTRNSGLEGDPIFGNPTMAMISALSSRGLRPLRAPFDPNYDLTRQDFAALRSIIPLQNLVGVKNILDAYQSRLPSDRVNQQ